MEAERVTNRLTCGLASLVACLPICTSVSAQESRTLAVAPFKNINAEPARDWIGVGIAETVRTDLRDAAGIDVLSRAVVDGAVANLGGAGPERPRERVLIEAVRELGADYLLAGAFQQLDQRLRLTARLIDVQSETAVEAFKVDGRQNDLFDLQDRLAGEVRAAVHRMAGRRAGARIATVEAETRAGNGSGNGDAAHRAGNGNGAGPPAGRRDGRDVANGAPEAIASGNTPGPLSAPAAPGGSRAAGGELLLGGATAPRAAPAAQTGPAAGFAIGGGRRSVQARRTSEPPVIDGRLDDAAWRDAVLITDFTQTNPVEGAPPTERTEVRIAYDADHLYFAFHAHYTDPTQMRANRADRDRFRRDDWIAVMFDPFLDQQRAYRFSVNAYGIQGDAILRGGRSMRGPPGGGGDSSWDALFESGARSSPTAGPRRWRFPSRACGIRPAAPASTAGASRSPARCSQGRDAGLGADDIEPSRASSPRWARWAACAACRRAGTWSSSRPQPPFSSAA